MGTKFVLFKGTKNVLYLTKICTIKIGGIFMLKIYVCTVEYSLQSGHQDEYLSTEYKYVIKDESVAVTKTKEWNAYSSEARSAYNRICEWKQTKRGIKTHYWTWDGPVCVKEWRSPNAKLVAHITYKEASCSIKQLMELPATDVIAYLKQEGLNLSMPS